VEEDVLWPESVRSQIKAGSDREIVTFYPFRSSCPKSVWTKLIQAASSELYFAGYTNYFLWLEQPHFGRTLQRKAQQGCRVRFLVGDPASETTRHREQIENVSLSVSTRIRVTLDELTKIGGAYQGRFSEDHIALSVFRFDDQMLVSLHLADLVGHDSPTLHLKRRQNDGLFDRFNYHAETLWNSGRPM
jgi:hypothetical protein